MTIATSPGIGHNQGPPLDAMQSWRRHCWKAARKRLFRPLPPETVRRRAKRAAELGLAYRRYELLVLGGGEVRAMLVAGDVLILRAPFTSPAAALDTAALGKLAAVTGCRRLLLAGHDGPQPARTRPAAASLTADALFETTIRVPSGLLLATPPVKADRAALAEGLRARPAVRHGRARRSRRPWPHLGRGSAARGLRAGLGVLHRLRAARPGGGVPIANGGYDGFATSAALAKETHDSIGEMLGSRLGRRGPPGEIMKTENGMKLIAGNSNRPLAEAIARRISVYRGDRTHIADARVERFQDREIFVEIFDNVRGEDVFIIQSTSNPANDNLMELLIMTDALKRASARRITAVTPYFGYARQDRKTSARTPISAKLVANLVTEAGVDRVLTMDLHAGQIQGFFDIPTDNLYAAPVFALDIKHHMANQGDLTVVSPDVGGVVRARDLAKRIGAELAIVDKRRGRPGEVESMTVIGEVKDRTCVMVDDICDTAGTLCKAAELLAEQGARQVHAYISHGVLSGPAIERITDSALKNLVITDSIEPTEAVKAAQNIRVVSIAPMFAQAILNVGNDTSVSSLFHEETLGPIYEAFYRFE